jgi:hypothetical protein
MPDESHRFLPKEMNDKRGARGGNCKAKQPDLGGLAHGQGGHGGQDADALRSSLSILLKCKSCEEYVGWLCQVDRLQLAKTNSFFR